MSTQTIKERPLVAPINTGRTMSWTSLRWKAVLAKKKQLMLGGAGAAVLGLAAFYFLGNQTTAAQYMTARVDRGNFAIRSPPQGPSRQ